MDSINRNPPTSVAGRFNTDHYYEIGNKHEVCQDYATSGLLAELAFGIISDGCSGSRDVDFGCRAMVFATKDALLNGMAFAPAQDFGKFVFERATKACSSFASLHPRALDATLLVALANSQQVRVLVFGDGVIVIRKPSGTQIVHIEYGTPAPFYLSCQHDPERFEQYKREAGLPKELETVDLQGGLKHVSHSKVSFADPVELVLPTNEVTSVSVISDGINTFREGDDSFLNYQNLVDEFTVYKSVVGSFQSRRMIFFRKSCLKNQQTHFDDISVATIIVQPEFFK
jgi:hypothetical protein